MNDVTQPDHEDFLDACWENHETLILKDRELDDSWRHGNYVADVYHRTTDDTYWLASYQMSGDGEYNGIRENEYNVIRVKPVEVVKTDYVTYDS